VDNLSNIADLVVGGISRSLRWQSHSHPDRGGRDHPDIQPGVRPAFGLRRDTKEKTRRVSRRKMVRAGSTWPSRTATPQVREAGTKTGGT